MLNGVTENGYQGEDRDRGSRRNSEGILVDLRRLFSRTNSAASSRVASRSSSISSRVTEADRMGGDGVMPGQSRSARRRHTVFDPRQDGFVHVNDWFGVYGGDPCCTTETFFVSNCSDKTQWLSACEAMDISTGHMVLSYMEDHLRNKDRLDEEWDSLCRYESDINSTAIALLPDNIRKNRNPHILPYDHSRVVLDSSVNVSHSDYINANGIADHDPKKPTYIATQGPLPHTVADFWQMVWEQLCVVIINLTSLIEDDVTKCYQYWPEQGSNLYHIYEVHVVSEHIWCGDCIVRSLYVKNVLTNETRTVSQYHFQTWPDDGLPASAKHILDFRKRVNKSYRGQSCPVIVHCSDGVGRTGTYCLIDMVLSRLAKGAKEIDISATLEHFRDQRMHMVSTKEQFEFALMAVAEEVLSFLKALPK